MHIPFCKKKCGYCDFVSYVGCERDIGGYMECVVREVEARGDGAEIGSVFFGGGTPTLVSGEWLSGVLGAIRARWRLADGAEISIEGNPGTVSDGQLRELRRAGFNRISFGVQAAQDALLRSIGRIHDRADAEAAISMARGAGFENINVDLMYALPGQSTGDWEYTLDWAIEQGVEHISAYSLIVEDGTPLKRAVDSGALTLPAEDDELAMLAALESKLQGAGYQRYEISNYAKPGYRCRHNLLYWANGEYIGLGVAAHSRLGMRRLANPAEIGEYMRALARGELPCNVIEEISPADDAFETIMLALRTTDGLNICDFIARHGFDPREKLATQLATLAQRGWLAADPDCIRLTHAGLLLQNSALVELMTAFYD